MAEVAPIAAVICFDTAGWPSGLGGGSQGPTRWFDSSPCLGAAAQVTTGHRSIALRRRLRRFVGRLPQKDLHMTRRAAVGGAGREAHGRLSAPPSHTWPSRENRSGTIHFRPRGVPLEVSRGAASRLRASPGRRPAAARVPMAISGGVLGVRGALASRPARLTGRPGERELRVKGPPQGLAGWISRRSVSGLTGRREARPGNRPVTGPASGGHRSIPPGGDQRGRPPPLASSLRVSGHLSPAGSQGRHGTGAPERDRRGNGTPRPQHSIRQTPRR